MHWLTAALMLATLAIAVYFTTLEEKTPGDPQRYFAWMPWHKTFGFLVLCVVVLRMPWFLANLRPELPSVTPRWQRFLAHVTHWVLYAAMLALPLLGWLGTSAQQSSFKLFTLWAMPRLLDRKDVPLSEKIYAVHVYLGWTVAALIALHVAAACWHQWVKRDGLLRRMWF